MCIVAVVPPELTKIRCSISPCRRETLFNGSDQGRINLVFLTFRLNVSERDSIVCSRVQVADTSTENSFFSRLKVVGRVVNGCSFMCYGDREKRRGLARDSIGAFVPFPRIVGDVEAPGQRGLFEVLYTRIFDTVKISVFENAEKRLVIG